MDIKRLRSFAAVAKVGSITRAAEELDMAQPTLSRQIQGLERDLGFKLFRRSETGVILTNQGETFAAAASSILENWDRTLNSLRRVEAPLSHVRIGFVGAGPLRLLQPHLERLKSSPVTCGLKQLHSDAQLNELDSHQLEFGVVHAYRPFPGFETRNLGKQRLALAMSRRHPLARHPNPGPADLGEHALLFPTRASRPSFYDLLCQLFTEQGRKPNILEEFPEFGAMTEAVRAIDAIAIVPEDFKDSVSPGVVYRPFNVSPLVLALIWRKDRAKELRPAIEAMALETVTR